MAVPRSDHMEGLQRQVFLAGRDLNFPRLRVRKGELLPPQWQSVAQVRWLREKYGPKVVVAQTVAEALATRNSPKE